MKFGLLFVNTGEFVQPDGLRGLASTAEAAGIESLWTVEHVVVPVGYRSRYPYSKTGRMPGTEDMPIPDPLVWLGYAAAVTTTLKLATGVLILPQRQPAYVAKQFATLDVLSGGRAIAGVGVGWLAEEFASVGVPFEERGPRTDESIQALRSLWSPRPEPFRGRFYRWEAVESNPRPVQPGGVPIVVGGHSAPAARRAARLGDGFFPARGTLDELSGLFDIVRGECERIGRDPSEVELICGGRVRAPEDLEPYAALGVTRFVVSPPAQDVDGLRRGLDQFTRDVIEPLRSA